MRCGGCGATVGDADRFCNSCGTRLAPDEASPPSVETKPDAASVETTRAALLPPPTVPPAPAEPLLPRSSFDDDPDPEVARQLAAMAAAVTPPPAPTLARADDDTASRPDHAPAATGSETVAMSSTADSASASTSTMGSVAPSSPPIDTATTIRTRTPGPPTGEVPASYGPIATATAVVQGGVRLRLVTLLAIIAAGVAIATTMSDIVTVEMTAGDPLFEFGTWRLNDLGTNNTVAAMIAAGLMAVGGVLSIWRSQLGAGLAGGAGIAVAGWSAMIIGLAELPLAVAAAGVRNEAGSQVAVTLTRDIGYWLVVAAGGAGVLVFLASLGLVRRVDERGLSPWIAAIGAAAALVAVAGPLLPRGDAEIDGNWTSAQGVDLPTLFFAGRVAQLGALAVTGVIGFLLVRRYGTGFVAGGFSIVTWLALTSLLELTTQPIGPAVANPGADNFTGPVPAEGNDLMPHAATVGGIAVVLFCVLVSLIEIAFSKRPRR